MVTDYSYHPEHRRLARLVAGTPGAAPFQNLAYGYDQVGNITSLANQVVIPKPGGYGGPVTQTFGYDDLDRLTSASGEWSYAPNQRESYELAMRYDGIHNITHKTQTHVRVPPGGREVVQAKTSYDWAYAYTGTQPHAPTQIGTRTFRYDANGNQSGWTSDANGTRRTLVWDEENRLRSVADNGRTQRYGYDATGERVFKWTAQGETAYVNRYFTVRNGTLASKHVFVGTTRLSSTLVPGLRPVAPGSGRVGGSGNQAAQSALRNPAFNSKFGGAHPGLGRVMRSAQGSAHAQDVDKNPHLVDGAHPPPDEPPVENPAAGLPDGNFLYYYHPDHLGSSSYVTDAQGQLYEHLQYFPFGETWVDQRSESQRVAYLFTGKELDEETGLYYFGARYYDPRTSVWQSADPILGEYLPRAHRDSANLPGLGGVYNPVNLALYSYTHQNPVKLTDPDGNVALPAVAYWLAGFGLAGGAAAVANDPQATSGAAQLVERTVKRNVAMAGMIAFIALKGPSTLLSEGMRNESADSDSARKLGDIEIPTDATPDDVRDILTKAGSPAVGKAEDEARATGETGTVHEVDINGNKVRARVMDGKGQHGPRISVTSPINPRQPVDPSTGETFKGNPSKQKQREMSHIPLKSPE